MKVFKNIFVLNILIFAHASLMSMQNVDLDVTPAGEFPVSVWQEIAKNYIFEGGKTEADIFDKTDRLMKLDGKPAQGLIQLIKTTGLKKGDKIYNYSDFKADTMQEILIKRAKQIMPLRPTSKINFDQYKNEIINQAINSEAVNWAKHRKAQDKNFQKKLNQLLEKSIDYLWDESKEKMNLKKVEQILMLGADPNATRDPRDTFHWPMLNNILMAIRMHDYKDNNIYEYIINQVKLFLKYGANPNLTDEVAFDNANDYAKKLLLKFQSPIEHYFGYEGPETRRLETVLLINTLKEIIKLFEESKKTKKPIQTKKQTTSKPYIGII